MSEDVGPWQEGQRAWDRLADWYPAEPSTTARHSADAERALRALTDIGLVRRLLDHAELTAVRAARKQGKSWTEIAISLGVTRQSAWERWRDIDDEAGVAKQTAGESLPQAVPDTEAVIATARAGGVTVEVPNVTGLKYDDACLTLRGRGLVGVGPDPAAPTWPYAVVTDQTPESGAAVPPRSSVILWTGRGDSGVREPRRPGPEPRTGRKVRVREEDS